MGINNPPTPNEIGAVPISRQVIAGVNMTGGGTLDNDVTLNSLGGGGGAFRGARLLLSDNLSAMTGINTLSWGNQLFDTDNLWSIDNPSRFIIPAGISYVNLYLGIRSIAATSSNCGAYILLNGATAFSNTSAGGFSNTSTICVSGPVSVTENDYFEAAYEYSNVSGRTIENNSRTFFGIEILQ